MVDQVMTAGETVDLRFGDLPALEVLPALDDEELAALVIRLNAELRRIQGLLDEARRPGGVATAYWLKITVAEQVFLGARRNSARLLLKERRAREADRREILRLRTPLADTTEKVLDGGCGADLG